MNSLIYSGPGLSDAASLISYLGSQSTFQLANHNGELVHFGIQKLEEGKPVFNEHGEAVLNECTIQYNDLIQELRKQRWQTFVVLDNIKNVFVSVIGVPIETRLIFLEELGSPGHSKVFFYGEDYQMVASRETCLRSVAKDCLTFKGLINGREYDMVIPFESIETMKGASDAFSKLDRLVFMSGMFVPVSRSRRINGKSMRIEELSFIASSFWFTKDSYSDVLSLIPKINSYDDVSLFRNTGNGEVLFPLLYNVLLWWNLFYVKLGDPVFNLILSGKPGTAKTTLLQIYAHYFADTGDILGEGGTIKGLVPSFSGDVPNPGALVDARFFVAIDEFFKKPGSNSERFNISKESPQYDAYLRDLLPVVSRQRKIYASAKNSKFVAIMKASMLGADNLRDKTRAALETLLYDDPAVLRRFCILYLDTEIWKVVKSAPSAGLQDNLDFIESHFMKSKFFLPSKLKRLAEYLREYSRKVDVDGSKCYGIMVDAFKQEVLAEFLKDSPGMLPTQVQLDSIDNFCMKVDFVPLFQGMVRCAAMMRSIFECKEEKLPEVPVVVDEDYNFACDVFKLVIRSEVFLFRGAISIDTNMGGIRREG